MFFAANITFRRRRERERKAIARIEAKREVKQSPKTLCNIFCLLSNQCQELRKRLEEEETTDEEDIEEECPKEPIFFDICKTENEQQKNNTKKNSA